MKKLLRLFLIMIVTFPLAILVIWQSWNYFEFNQRLIGQVREKLTEAFGDQLQVDDISFGLGSLDFENVIYAPADKSFRIWVAEIRLEYDPWEILSDGFNIEETEKQIFISKPKITVSPPANAELTARPDETRLFEALITLSDALSKMQEWTSFVQFNEGELLLENHDRIRTLLTDISGLSIFTDNQKTDINFIASLGENKRNVFFDCRVDLSVGEIDSLKFSAKYSFDEDLDFGKSTGFVLRDGDLEIDLVLQNQRENQEYVLTGEVSLKKGKAFLKRGDLSFEDIDMTAVIVNDSIRIVKGECLLNASRIYLTGDLKNLLHPSFWITLKSDEFSPKKWIEKLAPGTKSLVDGEGQLELLLSGTLDNPAFHGVFQSDRLFFQNLHLTKTMVNVSLVDSVLSFERAVAENDFNRFEGEGKVFLHDAQKTISATLKTKGAFRPIFEALNLPRLADTEGEITAEVSGLLNSPKFDGNFALNFPGTAKNDLSLSGAFEIEDWDIAFESWDHQQQLFAKGSIAGALSKPTFDFKIHDLTTAAQLLKFPVPAYFSEHYRLETSVRGTPSNLSLTLKGIADEKNLPFLVSTIKLREENNAHGVVTGQLNFYPEYNHLLSTSFAATYDDSVLHIHRIGDGHWVTGDLKVELRGERKVEGGIKLQGLELEEISAKDSNNVAYITGRAFGYLRLSGVLREPVARFDGGLINGYIRGTGIYDIDASAVIDRGGIRLRKFLINEGQKPFLALNGKISNAPGGVDLSLTGKNVDINHLLLTLSTKDSVVTGRADIDLKIKGSSWPLPTYGKIKVRDGKALWFSFDEIFFDLGDEKSGRSFVADDGWHVDRFSYIKNDTYVAEGSGLFPLNKQDSARIELRGTGNFLSTLMDFSEGVTSTSGYGKLDLKLGGPYKKMRPIDSRLEVFNGQFTLEQVVERVTDIDAKIVTDGNFIRIEALSGRIGGESLRISNYEFAPVRQGHLGVPLVLNRDWMSLGTLQINSSPAGVPLNVPGLMQPGEIGNFYIKGRGKQPKTIGTPLIQNSERIEKDEPGFFIAGPWEHPVFRGDVVLNNVNLTYPFIETSDSSNAVILNILMNADWDVLTIAGKDNHYVKELKFGISNFYVNLGLNDAASRLHFTGVMRDTSTFVPLAIEKDMAIKSEEGRSNGRVSTALALNDTSLETVRGLYNARWKEIRNQLVEEDTSSFRIEGQMESTRGAIEYFDLDFRIDKFSAIWDRSSWQPVLNGTAWTTIINDSLNRSDYVYLKLLARDPETGALKQRARLEDIYLEIESDNQFYNYSKVNLLAALGVKLNNFDDIREQATEFLTMNTERIVFRNLLRPVERKLRSSLGLDVVRLHSRFTRNFLEINDNDRTDLDLALALFRSSKVTLGKYLSDRMYFLYTGQLDTWPLYNTFETPNIGFRHTLGFEFRINPSLLLQMQYDYNNALDSRWREDKRIWLRHSFPF